MNYLLNKLKLSRTHKIGMPQMANDALSENWLFKELGDMHWDLLSKGFNKPINEFVNEAGKRLFPTFVRIQIRIDSLHHFHENQDLDFDAEISRFGNSTFMSIIHAHTGKRKLKATLMTIFSTRGLHGNAQLNRSHRQLMENEIVEQIEMPKFLLEYRALRKENVLSVYIDEVEFFVFNFYLYQVEYTINPYYDLNGVGLLYFASYPIISDKCEADLFNQSCKEPWESQYHTIARDVYYFNNCDKKDIIIYRLHYFETLDNGDVKIASSLYRKSDLTLMAKIFTIKGKVIPGYLLSCNGVCACDNSCRREVAL